MIDSLLENIKQIIDVSDVECALANCYNHTFIRWLQMQQTQSNPSNWESLKASAKVLTNVLTPAKTLQSKVVF